MCSWLANYARTADEYMATVAFSSSLYGLVPCIFKISPRIDSDFGLATYCRYKLYYLTTHQRVSDPLLLQLYPDQVNEFNTDPYHGHFFSTLVGLLTKAVFTLLADLLCTNFLKIC